MEREDVIFYLDSLRKSEASDPLHKWIGTYNLYRVLLIRFFRWLYYPDLNQKKRPKPSIVENIPQLKRKEQSIYKPTDLWMVEEDLLFLKYCNNARDRCYHAISRDLSCRPSEILNLHLKDIVFKTGGNYQYAEVLVNGKTGIRHIPLINSIPFLKDWMDLHPQRSNPNANLIPTLGDRSYGNKMTSQTLNTVYKKYKIQYFPKLLNDPSIISEDKQKISNLLKKPWNPYLRRHTEREYIKTIFRVERKFSDASKYLHYFGNESSESILEAYGLKPKLEEIDKMRPKQCPNCNEPNKIDSKFCVKCRMILSYQAYEEASDEKQSREDAVAALSDQIMKLMEEVRQLKSGK